MLRKAALILLLVFPFIHGSSIDTIGVVPGFFGNSFSYKGDHLRGRSDMKYLFIWSPKAYPVFKASKPAYVTFMTTAGVGVGLVGFSLVQGVFAIASDTPFAWKASLLGLGGIALSIPLHTRYNRKLSRAADLYNREILAKNALRHNSRLSPKY